MRINLLLNRLGTFLIVILACVACSKGQADPQYGRQIAAKYTFVAEDLSQFNQFLEQQRSAPTASPSTPSLARWVGPRLMVERESSPYTVVVKLTGKSRYRGDISTSLSLGWEVDGGVRTSAFPPLAKQDVEGDMSVVLTKAGAPVRFGESKTVALVIDLLKSENVNIEGLEVEVWNGVADDSWKDALRPMRWLGLLFVLLLIRYFWVRSKKTLL
ncbi:hypothetical protein RF679_02350 [Undibacterium cyanobacteriorum]|uniref:Uncharacterized protein n=1 Tax=Undibacterium cyanobacteriorum TaxID=3073561 RepID=A0ABY9RJM1_9BURK|nr:hypothetical protein [Undibacterium sp. 20NA77.5]WMW81136.1 hypothetical protein RF679_02350 [Undibacterium sp. 20NA77.5]